MGFEEWDALDAIDVGYNEEVVLLLPVEEPMGTAARDKPTLATTYELRTPGRSRSEIQSGIT